MSRNRYFALAATILLPAQFAAAVDGPVAPAAHFDYYRNAAPCASGAPGCATPGCADAGCASNCSSCADCSCDPCCCGGGFLAGLTLQNLLLGDDAPFTIAGWTQSGYHDEPTNTFPQTPLSFNNRPGKLDLHQAWLYAERVADGDLGLDWGFRFDVMYGLDGADTQAFGNPPGSWDFMNGFDHGAFGWALPQAYLEVASGDFSLKVGKFFTIAGYETVTAPDNFFYSHAFTMYNSEPFTHTGALGTYQYNDFLTLYGGWTLGWDSGFDQFQGGSNFLGGAAFEVDDDVTVTYVTTFGDLGWRGDDGYSHSLVLDIDLTESLNWVIQNDWVDANTGGAQLNDNSVGINQYLFYTYNDMFKFGSRMEWWKGDGVSHYGVTGGVNIFPIPLTVIRPEIRHQWSPAAGIDQWIFGIDYIRTF